MALLGCNDNNNNNALQVLHLSLTSHVSGQNLYAYLKLQFAYKLGWWGVLNKGKQINEYVQELVDEKFRWNVPIDSYVFFILEGDS